MYGTLSLYGSTSSAYALFKIAEQKKSTALESYARQPAVERELKYFKDKIGAVNSVDDLFRDRRLAAFILTSVGLGDDVNYVAKAKRVLSQQMGDKKSLMNVLQDPRYKSAAKILRLGEDGVATLKMPETTEKLAELYVMVRHEDDLQKQNGAVPLARYFNAKASSITSAYDILGDTRLRAMVLETLSLPRELAIQPVETQAATLERRLDLKKLQDPKFVDALVSRYLIGVDQKQANAGARSPILGLFGGQSGPLPGFNIIV
jgi:hypothetical protein